MTIDTNTREVEAPVYLVSAPRYLFAAHRDKEDPLFVRLRDYRAALDEINRLRAENDKLREALKKAGLARLEDELVKDVFAMSDAELEAELRESGVNTELFDKEKDDLVASALDEKETP